MGESHFLALPTAKWKKLSSYSKSCQGAAPGKRLIIAAVKERWTRCCLILEYLLCSWTMQRGDFPLGLTWTAR